LAWLITTATRYLRESRLIRQGIFLLFDGKIKKKRIASGKFLFE
jgi:hypothetical protein